MRFCSGFSQPGLYVTSISAPLHTKRKKAHPDYGMEGSHHDDARNRRSRTLSRKEGISMERISG